MWRVFFPAVVLFLVSLKLVSAEPVRINGSLTGGEGLKVELTTVSDYISNAEKVLATSIIGNDGFFDLTADLSYTMLCILKIGIQGSEILLEPGRNYNLRIKGLLDKNLRNKEIAPFQIPALHIEVLNPWRFELNGLVNEFYSFHNEFLAQNAMALVRARDRKIVDDYIQEVYNRFPGINNEWFNDLITYKIALIEMMARSRSRESIAEKYLTGNEILYYHPVFMDFFTQFFEKYIHAVRIYNPMRLVELTEDPDAYELMMKEFAKDTILRNNQLKELVLICSTADLVSLTDMNRHAVLNLLTYIQTNSKYNEHRNIARDLKTSLSRR